MPEQAGGGTPQGTSTPGGGGTPNPGGPGAAGGGTPPNQTPPITFDAWLAGQDDQVKGLLQQHTQGLKSALDAERTQRSDLSKQLKELQPKAEKGSDLEKLLTELQGKLEQSERRAAFAEEAQRPEIGCMNAKAAYALAVAEQLFDRKGNPDWAALKIAAPELFASSLARGFAGAGTGAPPKPAMGMNEFIRRSAGRG